MLIPDIKPKKSKRGSELAGKGATTIGTSGFEYSPSVLKETAIKVVAKRIESIFIIPVKPYIELLFLLLCSSALGLAIWYWGGYKEVSLNSSTVMYSNVAIDSAINLALGILFIVILTLMMRLFYLGKLERKIKKHARKVIASLILLIVIIAVIFIYPSELPEFIAKYNF